MTTRIEKECHREPTGHAVNNENVTAGQRFSHTAERGCPMYLPDAGADL